MDHITLTGGYAIPQLGYGVFTITDLAQCKQCVLDALKVGFRHIDTAQVYKNEEAVGAAWRESGIAREELFITSKLWTTAFGYKKAKKQIDVALQKLQTDYIDLMLLHRPFSDYKGAWRAMEDAVKEGKIRSIGLSNFDEKQLKDILSICTIPPAVNQIEIHPLGQKKEYRKYLAEKGIAVESWFPLGHGDTQITQAPALTEIASHYNKTTPQLILKWHLQEGLIVFPGTRNPKHMAEDFDLFDFTITEEDMQAIRAFDKNTYYDTTPVWWQKITALFQA